MTKTTNGFYEPNDPYDKYRNRIPNPYEPNPHEPWDKKNTPLPKPRLITVSDVFPRLDRLSIGWSPLLETLKEVTNNKPSYPPYDIVSIKDGVNLLSVAVAGFSKKELSITLQNSVITIEGKKLGKPKGEVLYQGIAARDFTLSLAVADYWEVTDAKVEDGMLTITFTKDLPEEMKPKVIDIN
jgi:molecular chaperone IbpA